MEFIGILITAGIIYFLYKKGLIKDIRFPVIKLGFVENHLKNSQLRLRYKTFNGISNYVFVVGANQNVHFDYEVEVDKGSLELTFRQRRKVIFHKEFHQSENGSFSFTSSQYSCFLLVTGKYMQGKYHVEFEKGKDAITK